MDFYAINGNAINGTSVSPVAASANINPTVGIAAAATRIVYAAAVADCTASVSAGAISIEAASATFAGQVDIYNTPQLRQAAAATFQAGATIVAAVYRNVQASAQIDCHVDIQAIPASVLASANVTGVAGFTASATKIQPGQAPVVGSVTITEINGAPTVTRNVAAVIACTAAMRVEAQVNHKVDAFAEVTGTANLTTPDSGIVLRQGVAYFELLSNLQAAPTYVFANDSATIDVSCDIEAFAVTLSVPFANVSGAASFTAQAVRLVLPTATFPVSVDLNANAVQRQAAAATFAGTVDLAVNPKLTQMPSAAVTGSADLGASATVLRMASAGITGSADLAAVASNKAQGAAQLSASADIVAAPVRMLLAASSGALTADFQAYASALMGGSATITPSADIVAPARRTTQGVATFAASMDFTPNGVVKVLGASIFGVSVSISADARLNIEAYDPPERTMYRPALDTEIYRPFIDTELRRYA